MIRIKDEAEAFSVLEQFGAAEFDFTKQHIRLLRSPQQIVFFMFCPAGVSKGAHVFTFDNPPVAGEIENDLLNEVMHFSGDESTDRMRDDALDFLRDYLENKSAEHYFFDAH